VQVCFGFSSVSWVLLQDSDSQQGEEGVAGRLRARGEPGDGTVQCDVGKSVG
jgi:hypothetical protein